MTKAGPERDVSLLGTIERFTFRNPDTGWAVVRLRVEGADALATVVGAMAQLKEGQRLKVVGKEVAHPQFGLQVKVETFEAVAPSNAEGIAAYLASGLVRGIGPATAEKIVRTFGADTLRIVEDEPEQLRRIKGLGERRIEELSQAVKAQKDVQNVLVFLRTHGLGAGLAASTLHRLLEYTPGLARFARQHNAPLDGAMLVVDEVSMLDVQHAHALLQAVPPTMTLVLVGDRNQLPSVGPGNVLAEVIASGRVPT
ncbi:MAG: AAA family ATPase, partial [Planctomycetota bacterium]